MAAGSVKTLAPFLASLRHGRSFPRVTAHRQLDRPCCDSLRAMPYILIIAFVVGLLLFLLCQGDKKEIGRMLFFSSVLALLIAAAPATLHLLHG